MVKWQFLGFKDVTRFGSVTDILSYFTGQLNFPGASIKFQDQPSHNVKFIPLENHLTNTALPSNQDKVIYQNIFMQCSNKVSFSAGIMNLVHKTILPWFSQYCGSTLILLGWSRSIKPPVRLDLPIICPNPIKSCSVARVFVNNSKTASTYFAVYES